MALVDPSRVNRYVFVTAVSAEVAAPVLRRYLREVAVVRSYFDVNVDSSLEDCAARAYQHPVCRIGEL